MAAVLPPSSALSSAPGRDQDPQSRPRDAARASPAVLEEVGTRLCATGAWNTFGIVRLNERSPATDRGAVHIAFIDATRIEALDTNGAWMLAQCARDYATGVEPLQVVGLDSEREALFELVRDHDPSRPPAPPRRRSLLVRIGSGVAQLGRDGNELLAFFGEMAIEAAHGLARPREIRWRAVAQVVERAGFDALPIVGMLCFLLGVVIAYQGGAQLKSYGANIFVVELSVIALLREIAPLMTAVIVAGRTGSAYAAEIATMKVNEEVDALRVMALRPARVLVLPKVAGLIIAVPLLTVFGDIMAVLGAMVMAQAQLDVSFDEFLGRIPDVLSVNAFVLGIIKTPVFALLIALTGCYQGFQARGGANSVGERTTVSRSRHLPGHRR